MIRDLPPVRQVLLGHDAVDAGNLELIVFWCWSRNTCRDGAIRLLGVEQGVPWDTIAHAADEEIRVGRLARVHGMASLLEHVGDPVPVTALLLFRHVFVAVNEEVRRRLAGRPNDVAYARVRESESEAIAALTRALGIRRVVRGERLSPSDVADAEQEAMTYVVGAFRNAGQMAVRAADAQVSEEYVDVAKRNVFQRYGFDASPDWERESKAFLRQEIRWAVEDWLAVLDGTTGTVIEHIRRDQESSARRESRRQQLRLKYLPIMADNLHVELRGPDTVVELARHNERAGARVESVRALTPTPVWDAYVETLYGVSNEDAAVKAGLPLSTFKKHKRRIRDQLKAPTE